MRLGRIVVGGVVLGLLTSIWLSTSAGAVRVPGLEGLPPAPGSFPREIDGFYAPGAPFAARLPRVDAQTSQARLSTPVGPITIDYSRVAAAVGRPVPVHAVPLGLALHIGSVAGTAPVARFTLRMDLPIKLVGLRDRGVAVTIPQRADHRIHAGRAALSSPERRYPRAERELVRAQLEARDVVVAVLAPPSDPRFRFVPTAGHNVLLTRQARTSRASTSSSGSAAAAAQVELPDPTLITDPVTDQVDETQGYASELVPPNTGRPLPYTLLTPGDTDLNPDGSTGVETDPVTGDDNSLVPLGAAADGVAVTLPFQLDNPCAGGSPDPCDPKPGSWDPVDVGAIVANPKGLPSAIAGPLLLQGKAIATSAGYVCAFTPQKTHRKFIGGGGDEVRGEIKNPCYGDTSHISSVSLFAQVQYYHHTLHRDHVTAHWRNAGNSNTSNWYGAYNHATVYASSLCSGTHTWRVTGHGDVYLKAGAVPNHLHQSGSGPSHVITCN